MGKARGAGTKLAIGSNADVSTAVFTNLKFTRSLKLTRSNGEVEVTDLDSVAKEYISDLPDGGSLSGSVFYDPNEATHADVAGIEALLASSENRAWRLTPNGATKHRLFVGFVRTSDINFEPTTPMQLDFEIRISGGTTYVAV